MQVQKKELTIQTEKGDMLSSQCFFSDVTSKHVLVISSATGVLQKYYSKFATYAVSLGFKVYTFDYSGIGNSGSEIALLKQNSTNLLEWGSDNLAAVIAYAKKENSDAKVTLITHSVGGQIAGFNSNYKSIDKMVIVASQTGYWKYFKGIHFPKMWLLWYIIIPFLTTLFGYFPSKKLGLFENLPKGMVYQWAQWGKKKEYFMHYYNRDSYFFDQFKIPMLAYSFQNDTYAPKETVDWLVAQYKNATVKRIHFTPEKGMKKVKHFGFFKSSFQHLFWDTTLQWILNEDDK